MVIVTVMVIAGVVKMVATTVGEGWRKYCSGGRMVGGSETTLKKLDSGGKTKKLMVVCE